MPFKSPQNRPSRQFSSWLLVWPSSPARLRREREQAAIRLATSETTRWRGVSGQKLTNKTARNLGDALESSRPRTRPCRRRSRPTARQSLRSGQRCTLPDHPSRCLLQFRVHRAWTQGQRRRGRAQSHWRRCPSARLGSPRSTDRNGRFGVSWGPRAAG